MTDDRHDDDRDDDGAELPGQDALSAGDRAALARWQPEGAPAGFADRVLAARAAPAAVRPSRRARVALIGAAVAAAAAATVVMVRPRGARLGVGAAAVAAGAARETVAIGGRAVAVAEPGAALAYVVGGGAARVDQPRGDVFYRVEPGGRFDVVTPVGTVEVTGTCFRVEVRDMIGKQVLLSGVLGAAVASAAVITVYEGKIRVVGGGAPVEVKAGEQATLTAGSPSTVALHATPPAAAGGAAPVLVQVDGPPEPAADTLTREQLIARDRAQREQLALLAQRVAALESGKRPGGPRGLEDDWLNPSPEDLREWAKTCKIKIDFPPVMQGRPMTVPPESAKAVGLTDAEVTAANAAFVQVKADWATRVRGWYIEATGDAAGADSLSPHAMGQELQDKAAPGEPNALQRRLSHERAGLAAPPADASKLSPFERYFRALADLGDETERRLAAAIGPEKAHKIRAENGGWPARMSMDGCDDEDTDGVPAP